MPSPGAVKPNTGAAGGADGGAVPAAKPLGPGGKVAIGAGVAGLSFAGIFGGIMLFPKAVGDVMFPFLPEEMRPFACCCSYCSSVMAMLGLVVFMMVRR